MLLGSQITDIDRLKALGQQKFNESMQEPITRSLQLPHVPVTAFSRMDLFLV